MIILSACNLAYKKYMDCLVNSVLRNTPYQIRVEYLNTKGMSQEDAADYCANYRLQMFLTEYREDHNLLWLDADTIVRSDISQLDEWLEEGYPCCAVYTPEMGPPGTMNHWLISTVGISRKFQGYEFLKEWDRIHQSIYTSWKPSIMTVQQSFVSALEKFKGGICKDITYHFSDKNMLDESPIWEAQGARKADPQWLAEMEKYK